MCFPDVCSYLCSIKSKNKSTTRLGKNNCRTTCRTSYSFFLVKRSWALFEKRPKNGAFCVYVSATQNRRCFSNQLNAVFPAPPAAHRNIGFGSWTESCQKPVQYVILIVVWFMTLMMKTPSITHQTVLKYPTVLRKACFPDCVMGFWFCVLVGLQCCKYFSWKQHKPVKNFRI